MTAQTALGFAVLGAVLIFVLRESKSPLAPLLSLFAGTLLLSAALARYAESELFTVLASLSEKEETKTVFKVLSVGLLTEIGADTCDELGAASLGKRLVFFGNAEIFFLVFPVLRELLTLSGELL